MFIIHTHIPLGIHYAGGEEVFWKYDNLTAYLRIFELYRQKILYISAGHIHTSDIRLPRSQLFPNLKLTTVSMPSTTGLYLNNPGYTLIKMSYQPGTDNQTVKFTNIDVAFRFF